MSNPKLRADQVVSVDPNTDALQIKDSRGNTIGWIDSSGTGQGSLQNSGATDSKSIQGNPVSPSVPQNNQVLTWNGSSWIPSSPVASSNAAQLQGNPVSSTPPQIGQVMKWNGIAWIPQTISASGINFSDAEIPAGTADGFNLNFTLSNSPGPPASLQLFRNGTLLTAGQDYTLSVSTITFSNAPMNGDILEAFYRF